MKEKLYIIDGYGLIYKSYFAFLRSPLYNENGENVSALIGFFRSVFSLIQRESPKYLLVAMDAPWPTFRHDIYPEYKANREETPQELRAQIEPIWSLLKAMGIPVYQKQGFEADDIMGTMAKMAEQEGWECSILSSDKDLLQLVNDNINIIKQSKGQWSLMDDQAVYDDKGVHANQVIDYLALIGDSSDNVPGVTGIGPKTASKLLQDFHSLAGIYDNIESIKSAAQKKKLLDQKDMAFFSQKLVTIDCNAPLDITLESTKISGADDQQVVEIAERWGLSSLIRDFSRLFERDITVMEEQKEVPLTSYDPEESTYTLIQSEEELTQWLEEAKNCLFLSLDTETDSTDPMKAELAGISLSVKPNEACYIPVQAPEGEATMDSGVLKKNLEIFLSNSNIRLVGQNIKYDKKVLLRWGLDIGPVYFDTMIAAWVLESNNRYNLDHLANRYLNYNMISFKDVVPKGKVFKDIPLEEALAYAAEDADITLRLFQVLKPKIQESKMDKLFHQLEMPLIDVLLKMEMKGVLLESSELADYSVQLAHELKEIETEVYDLAGQEFNMQSPKQLQEILFNVLELPPQKKNKTGYSTDTSVLEILSQMHPVPQLILKNRSLSKLKSTYVDKLPQDIHGETKRIHTSFMQTGTATGRLSSKDPNLQNIPVRNDQGRRIRSAFKAEKGKILVSADYSQIELVLLAHLSGDEGLIDAFSKGVDIHSKTASILFHCPVEEVTSQQRRVAKSINFGVIYGMSAFRLSNELKIPRKEASSFIDSYFSQYQGVNKFIDETIALAEKQGGVFTLAERFRPIPSINSRNKTEQKAAQRMAVNTVIQGSAADIVKQAMLAVDYFIETQMPDVSMLLQVHDEFIFELPEEKSGPFIEKLKEIMEGIVPLRAPLCVNCEEGKDWGEMH